MDIYVENYVLIVKRTVMDFHLAQNYLNTYGLWRQEISKILKPKKI
jgi:hypothetical protein